MAALRKPYSISTPITKFRPTGTNLASSGERRGAARWRSPFPWEIQVSLVVALASQASIGSAVSRRALMKLPAETVKYAFPRRISEARNLEEVRMPVPDLETVVSKRMDEYVIRDVECSAEHCNLKLCLTKQQQNANRIMSEASC